MLLYHIYHRHINVSIRSRIMKIIINGRFLVHKITGVSRYAREILSELDKIVPSDSIELAIPPETEDVPNYINIKVKRIGNLHNRLWEHISFPHYVKKSKAVSLNLCNVAPLVSPGIVCIHDMKIKSHPEYFSTAFCLWNKILLANQTKRAKKIITVSEFSKKEIMKYYNISEEKIIVIPNAWQHYKGINYDSNILSKYSLACNKYYFALGSLEPNKNLKWIASKALEMPDYQFVVAGGINKQLFADGLNFSCPDNMILLGYISDEEAKTLMKNCEAFLFPSFYEGFGIPPLEAISCGCRKIVISDIEVMHEIYGESAYYINPNNTQDNICNLPDKPIELVYEPLNRFNWSNSAQLLYDQITHMRK